MTTALYSNLSNDTQPDETDDDEIAGDQVVKKFWENEDQDAKD